MWLDSNAKEHFLLNLAQSTYFSGSGLLTNCTVFVATIIVVCKNITFNGVVLEFGVENLEFLSIYIASMQNMAGEQNLSAKIIRETDAIVA